jgi:phage terminase small subunit
LATASATSRAGAVAELAPRILDLLPGKQAAIAQALGRASSDGSVRRALDKLANEGFAERVDGVWRRCQEVPTLPEGPYPDDFDQVSIGLYDRTQLQLLAQGTWKEGDRPLLESYVRSKQLAREARAKVAADGAYPKNGSGRVFRHPAIEDARGHERDALAFAEALLIPPKARGQRAGEGGSGPDEFDL